MTLYTTPATRTDETAGYLRLYRLLGFDFQAYTEVPHGFDPNHPQRVIFGRTGRLSRYHVVRAGDVRAHLRLAKRAGWVDLQVDKVDGDQWHGTALCDYFGECSEDH